MRHTFAIGFALSLIGGCSSGGTDENPTAAFNDFMTKSAAASCATGVKCGYLGASEEKRCESDAANDLKKFVPTYDPREAIKARRLVFDTLKSKACLAALAATGCTPDQLSAPPAACDGIFKAAVAPGGMCKESGECITGYCNRAQDNPGCPGVCADFLVTGATCDPAAPHCAASDYCDRTTKKCTARLAAGDSCAVDQCEIGLFCKGYLAAGGGFPAIKGTCKGPGAVGEECEIDENFNTDCQPGLWCDDSGATLKCAARLASGATCASQFACPDGTDCVGLTYDARGNPTNTGKCLAYLDVAAMCDPTPDVSGCPYDTTCDTNHTCTLDGTLGSACTPQGCGNDLYCDSASKKCSPIAALGQPCTPAGVDARGNPTGDEPCHDGQCDPATQVCALICM